MSTTDRYTDWDAAYVLGALSSSERHEFEEHLATCDRCADSVADFAVLPGLLGSLPASDVQSLLGEPRPIMTDEPIEGVPAVNGDVLPILAARVRRERRARRGWTIAAFAAAAAVIAGAIVLPQAVPGQGAVSASSQQAAPIQLQPTVPTALTASVRLTSRAWGTQVDMTCAYARVAHETKSYTYGLYATDSDGVTTLVSSWDAAPGSTVRTSGSLEAPSRDLRRIQIREQSTGTVLLSRAL